MVAIVNFLLENEFIVVRVNPQDRRENFISLADKGKRAVYRIKKVERYVYGHVLNGGIDDDTIPALFESLSKLELKLKRVNNPITDEKARTTKYSDMPKLPRGDEPDSQRPFGQDIF
jgi:uncharacterized protein (DUF927 family)